MGEANSVISLLQKMNNVKDLLKCKYVLDGLVSRASVEQHHNIKSKNIQDYVEYDAQFISTASFNYETVAAEVESLELKCKSSPSTKWLTSTGLSYSWNSNNGNKTIKEPVDISDYRAIASLMYDINKKYNTSFNSVLITQYDNGNFYSPYHDDNEEELDSESPMVVVSFGAPRSVSFIHQGRCDNSKPLLELKPADGSVYIMKFGCQEVFFHSVKRDGRIKKKRFSLSFRKILPKSLRPAPPVVLSPVKTLIDQFDNGCLPKPVVFL